MSSKIEITKVCLLCGKAFIARKTTTSYCSEICAKRAYKERIRNKKVESVKNEASDKLYSSRAPTPKSDEFLTPTKTARLLGIGRATLYRYLADNIIKCITMKGKTLIRRSDIDALFYNAPQYEKKRGLNTNQAPITDFYTMEEIKAKYSVKESWVFKIVKQKRIPRTIRSSTPSRRVCRQLSTNNLSTLLHNLRQRENETEDESGISKIEIILFA